MVKQLIVVLMTMLCSSLCFGQLNDVIVERYYISDANDATDVNGGTLPAGTSTYRIFIDMQPGSKLKKIYGDTDHAIKFSSTEPFFNHYEEGVSFAKDLNKNRYSNGTAPLDTWLTIGQCSKVFGNLALFGILKEKDVDGSLVGGQNNDGGSEEISGGLLRNENPLVGIPLLVSDGLMTSSIIPNTWVNVGFIDQATGIDTTIFVRSGTEFSSNNAFLQNSGVEGFLANSNHVIVGQMTTSGALSFEINLEIEMVDGNSTKTVKYVASNIQLKSDEIYSPLLKYPKICGCKDPNYLEASTEYACIDNSLCKTPIVLGCMDTLACNFDPKANFNVSDLCCYVGYCNNRDINVICPDLSLRDLDGSDVNLFPNPVFDELRIEFPFINYMLIDYTIYDMEGHIASKDKCIDAIQVGELSAGIYLLKLVFSDRIFYKKFYKD